MLPGGRAALLVFSLLLAACDRGRVPRAQPLPTPDDVKVAAPARSPRHANYVIAAALDPSTHLVSATQTLTWTNYGQSPVETLPFHLYLNGFKNESSLFLRSARGQHRSARATESWGYIEVASIRLGGDLEVRPRARFLGPDETVLEVPLPTPLAPGESLEIKMRYSAKLPEVFARTGYKGDFHLVAQWFPKIGVRAGVPGAETWVCDPFHVNAEFFADFGTYEVDLTVPDAYVVAATGSLISVTQDDTRGVRTLRYRAEDVHDFAWMADPYMVKLTGTAQSGGEPVLVRVFHRPEQRAYAKRHLDAAIATVEVMSELFGPYPWPTLTVIDPPMDAADGAGGMEYPTFVTTAGDSPLARPGLRLPELVTVHEVGHQWFQGMLASNEALEPWLDEGINQWANGVVLERIYGGRGNVVDWHELEANLYDLLRASLEHPDAIPTPIATAAHAFVDSPAYFDAVYQRTALALRTLEGILGRDELIAAVGEYARRWAFKQPTGRDFFAALSQHAGRDLSWFFEPVFYQTGNAELKVRSIDCRQTHEPRGVVGEGTERRVVTEASAPATGAHRCSVIVQNTGAVRVPVDVELVFQDGTRERMQWLDSGHGRWKELAVVRSSQISEVIIDPDDKVLLADPLPMAERVLGDPSASYRAAARMGFWAQQLMRLGGP